MCPATAEEIANAGVGAYGEAFGREQETQGVAHSGIVVDYMDDARAGHWGRPPVVGAAPQGESARSPTESRSGEGRGRDAKS